MNRIGKRSILGISIAVLLALAGPALAQKEIHKTVDLDKDGAVVVSNISGSVTVTGWDQEKVEITGTLGEGTKELKVEGDRTRVEIKVVLPKWARDVEETVLEIRVPVKSRLTISTVSADVNVSGVEGRLRVEAVSGDVTAAGAPEEVEVETVSGRINLETHTARIQGESVSGDIGIVNASGELDAQTVSGEIEVTGGQFGEVDLETVSGDLRFEGEMGKGGSYSFGSHSGNIDLVLVGEVDAEFDLTTFSGHLESDLGQSGKRVHVEDEGKSFAFTVGDGSAEVEVETFSGDVTVERK